MSEVSSGKGKKTKIAVAIVVLAVLLLAAGYDFIRAKTFHIDLVSITPEEIEADGKTEVTITCRLTDRHGNPVEGHNLYAFPNGGGNLKANRETTDKDGVCVYTYFPYKLTSIMPLKDVTLDVIDESNSVFLEINTRNQFVIALREPSKDTESSMDLSFIFGD